MGSYLSTFESPDIINSRQPPFDIVVSRQQLSPTTHIQIDHARLTMRPKPLPNIISNALQLLAPPLLELIHQYIDFEPVHTHILRRDNQIVISNWNQFDLPPLSNVSAFIVWNGQGPSTSIQPPYWKSFNLAFYLQEYIIYVPGITDDFSWLYSQNSDIQFTDMTPASLEMVLKVLFHDDVFGKKTYDETKDHKIQLMKMSCSKYPFTEHEKHVTRLYSDIREQGTSPWIATTNYSATDVVYVVYERAKHYFSALRDNVGIDPRTCLHTWKPILIKDEHQRISNHLRTLYDARVTHPNASDCIFTMIVSLDPLDPNKPRRGRMGFFRIRDMPQLRRRIQLIFHHFQISID
jgi:hypothetical protein